MESYGYKSTYAPTGKLAFRIEKLYGPGKEWVEGKKQIEEMLPDILIWLEMKAKELIREGQEREEHERIREEERKLKEERQAKEQAEKEKYERLIEVANRKHLAKIISEYLNALENKSVEIHGNTEEITKFILWAMEKVDEWESLA